MITRSTTMIGQSWRSTSRSSNSYGSTTKMILMADFIMNVLTTMGQLCILRVLVSKISWTLSNHKNIFCSLAPLVYMINPWLLIPSSESRLRGIFWWYFQSECLTPLKSYECMLLSSTLSKHNLPMVGNPFIRKSAMGIIRGIMGLGGTSIRIQWPLNWPSTLTGHCGWPGGHCTLNRKTSNGISFISWLQKKSALAPNFQLLQLAKVSH